MHEAVQTLEGWYVSHDLRTIDWSAWRKESAAVRAELIAELEALDGEFSVFEQHKTGGYGLYAMAGNKSDLMWVQLRPTLEELISAKARLNKSRFADFTHTVYSYLSVVELSGYLGKPGSDPSTDPYVQGRLRPELPKMQYACFYPMSKRRDGADNWYMLPMEERRELMRSHGLIGRSYAGKIVQIISGSTGLDDWEWGVTLYADDPVQFKKIVYEMRFDEASARYGDFGPFYVGSRITAADLSGLLAL